MKDRDQTSRPDEDSQTAEQGTWIIRRRHTKRRPDQTRLPRPDLRADVDVTRLSDEEFKELLRGDEGDKDDDLDWTFDERPDPNFLAQFREPMTEAEEEEFAMAIMEAIVSAFEEAFGEENRSEQLRRPAPTSPSYTDGDVEDMPDVADLLGTEFDPRMLSPLDPDQMTQADAHAKPDFTKQRIQHGRIREQVRQKAKVTRHGR